MQLTGGLRIIDPPKYPIGEVVVPRAHTSIRMVISGVERAGNYWFYEFNNGYMNLPEFCIVTPAELVAEKLMNKQPDDLPPFGFSSNPWRR